MEKANQIPRKKKGGNFFPKVRIDWERAPEGGKLRQIDESAVAVTARFILNRLLRD